MLKPELCYSLLSVVIHYKPWKGKVNNMLVIVKVVDSTEIHSRVMDKIKMLRTVKGWKQRKAISYTISL